MKKGDQSTVSNVTKRRLEEGRKKCRLGKKRKRKRKKRKREKNYGTSY